MSPRDEETVERYIRYPETLSETEKLRVGDLLRADPVARRLAAFYRSFYDELDALKPPAARALDNGAAGRNDDAAPEEAG